MQTAFYLFWVDLCTERIMGANRSLGESESMHISKCLFSDLIISNVIGNVIRLRMHYDTTYIPRPSFSKSFIAKKDQ